MSKLPVVLNSLIWLACAAAPTLAQVDDAASPPTSDAAPATATAAEDSARPDERAATTVAEEEAAAPERVGDRIPRGPLQLQTLSLELGFEGSYDQNRVRYDVRDNFQRRYRQTNRSRFFQETIGLRTNGSMFGEDLLLFDAAIAGGWTQERFSETVPTLTRSGSPDGSLFEYDVSMTLFPRGKVSVSGFATRQDGRLPRAFQPSLDRTYERYGAGIYYNDAKFPVRITYEHDRDYLTSRTRALDDDQLRGRDTLRIESAWQISPTHVLRAEYEYEDRTEQYSGLGTQFDTNRHFLTLTHLYQFGLENRSSLQTLVRLQEEQGELARDIAEWSTRLRLQHTGALATWYGVQYRRDTFYSLSADSWRGEVGLEHQLSDWLTTTAQLYGLRQSADANADVDEWGGYLSSQATFKNDAGVLTARATYTHTTSDTNDGGRRGVIIAESVTLKDPIPARLSQLDIVRTSIIVTDNTRARTYLPARDYVVTQVGRYTTVTRVPNGDIADNETVLVSYTYESRQDFTLNRDRVDVRVQQDFKNGWSLFYAGSIQNENLDNPKLLPFRARNENRHRLGATYRRQRWSVGGEYEYYDDAIDPYSAVRVNGDVTMWQSAQGQLNGNASVQQFWFEGSGGLPSRNTFLFDTGAQFRYLARRDLELTSALLYRWEDDTLLGITQGVDWTAGVTWSIGYFDVLFETEYDLLDLQGSNQDTLSFWLKLRRTIPLIASASGSRG